MALGQQPEPLSAAVVVDYGAAETGPVSAGIRRRTRLMAASLGLAAVVAVLCILAIATQGRSELKEKDPLIAIAHAAESGKKGSYVRAIAEMKARLGEVPTGPEVINSVSFRKKKENALSQISKVETQNRNAEAVVHHIMKAAEDNKGVGWKALWEATAPTGQKA